MSSNEPKTSVIITTHERPQLLRRAVESAFLAGTNVEVVVVDDASIDETAKVCEQLPGIIYVRLNGQLGVAGARNIGISVSSGEYITFLDDDDLRLPQSIDRQLEHLEADSTAALIYGQAICLDQGGQQTDIYPKSSPEGDVFWTLMGENFIPCGASLIRRSCLDTVGCLDERANGIDDWDLWIRIAESYSVMSLPEPIIKLRMATPSSRQGSSDAAAIVTMCIRQYRERWSELARFSAAAKEVRQASWERLSTNLARHLCWNAFRCFQHRNLSQALKNCLAFFKFGPVVWVRLWRTYGGFDRLLRFSRKTLASSSVAGEARDLESVRSLER